MKTLYALIFTSLSFAATATAQHCPYINKVYEYRPAPGQFVNTMPKAEAGMTEAEVVAATEAKLASTTTATPGMITLGAFGGYVTFGFDHPVQNVPGQRDFKVYGNANVNGAEPGIVMVARDENKNGIPDDAWYELAGSDYTNATTLHAYTVTYTRPEKPLEQDYAWTSNASDAPTGSVVRNGFHKQDYWPLWLADHETLTFSGTRLAPNAVQKGTQFQLPALAWGYADNLPNASEQGMDIGWAVDETGASVTLPEIDFVRVYTAMQQTAGWLGETSTEISGAEDLHPDATPSAIAAPAAAPSATRRYNALGIEQPTNARRPGLYIVRQAGTVRKVIVR